MTAMPDSMTGFDQRPFRADSSPCVVSLFSEAFSATGGEAEGRLLGKLVSELCAGIDEQDIYGFVSYEKDTVVGAIFFSRLRVKVAVNIMMLAPVAVHPAYQRKGIGRSLIQYGLQVMREQSVDVAITYGDPAYYSRTGFQPLSEARIPAPLRLSMPHGWQGQSLSGEEIPTIHERPVCVDAFLDPVYW